MDFNKMYIVLGSDINLAQQDVNQLINDTFTREFQEGRKWGKFIQDAVARNVDLETQDFWVGVALFVDDRSIQLAR